VPASRISLIVNEKREITAETAARLGRYFGTSAQYWLNIQNRSGRDRAGRDSKAGSLKLGSLNIDILGEGPLTSYIVGQEAVHFVKVFLLV
jgi:hypothetical protein